MLARQWLRAVREPQKDRCRALSTWLLQAQGHAGMDSHRHLLQRPQIPTPFGSFSVPRRLASWFKRSWRHVCRQRSAPWRREFSTLRSVDVSLAFWPDWSLINAQFRLPHGVNSVSEMQSPCMWECKSPRIRPQAVWPLARFLGTAPMPAI